MELPPKKKTSLMWKALGGVVAGGVAFLVVDGYLADPEPVSAPDRTITLEVSSLPRMTGEQRTEYLATLSTIDQGLVVNEDRAVSRGESTCLDIQQGVPEGQVLKNLEARITEGDTTVKVEGAALILDAVKAWCR
ncbi:DUF732 domain-containing protein [Herbidospora sp. NBRC 101105]|uniref:DUF732 domain-containing protein n=1 Tax=Herbidospora sp. NBRC 101105 TaxID=3032195 RepID=UPI002553A1D4|nr:DUF732 domain-containing protein [Herbidospora sp. NBRC 101105]